MSNRVEKSFFVSVTPARAWRAFADSHERSQWEASEYEIDPRPGGRLSWALPGHACEGRVVEVVPERLLRHTEGSGPHAETEVRVELEPEGAGTRVRITHSGLGDEVDSVSLGWGQAVADLIVYLERGVAADRFVRRMSHTGVWMEETPGGLEVRSVDAGGFGERVGLRPGDLLLAVDGVPIFTRPELWVTLRAHVPGDKLSLEVARDGERASLGGEL
jgi:uncharacterized protein YndB with AHSA1/START domain